MHNLHDSKLPTVEVARSLLGSLLISCKDGQLTSGWIVETEAYLGKIDQACHSFEGKETPRLTSMYKEAGTIYIYRMHTHHLFNVVTRNSSEPQAVLIRAIEPYEGEDIQRARRGKDGYTVTNGPGKLAKALSITMDDNGSDIYEPAVRIDPNRKRRPRTTLNSARIGIPNKGKWTDELLRYSVKGNPYVSGKKGKTEIDYGWDAVLN